MKENNQTCRVGVDSKGVNNETSFFFLCSMGRCLYPEYSTPRGDEDEMEEEEEVEQNSVAGE